MTDFKAISAQWYSRKETLEKCSIDVLSFLEKLKNENSVLFGKWYKKAKSKRDALANEIPLDYNTIKKLLSKTGNDNDYPEISYSAGIWNGGKEEENTCAISFSLGSDEDKLFTNFFSIDLPYDGPQHIHFQNLNEQKKLLSLMRQHWNPEWILVDGKRVVI